MVEVKAPVEGLTVNIQTSPPVPSIATALLVTYTNFPAGVAAGVGGGGVGVAVGAAVAVFAAVTGSELETLPPQPARNSNETKMPTVRLKKIMDFIKPRLGRQSC